MSTHTHSRFDRDPHFASEAQEAFTAGARVYLVADTLAVKAGAEGAYVGRFGSAAVVDFDTPSGEPYRVGDVPFDCLRNLYR